MLDRDLTEHHAAFGIQTGDHQIGVAYPAVFVLDEEGRVADKRIGENYRAREGALTLLEAGLGLTVPPGGPAGQTSSPHVRIKVSSDSPQYVRWERSRLHVEFEVADGWHVYGRPIPSGYAAVTVEVSSIPEVSIGEPAYPETEPFHLDGLDEQFRVNEGRFDIRVPIAVNVPPGRGPVAVNVGVRYQACSATECLPPAEHSFDLSLEEAPPA